MNLTKITAVALAVLLVGAGAAAAIPGQAADQAHSNANDDGTDAGPGAGAPDDAGAADEAGNATDNESADAGENASERRGPPEDMPSQAPDHVSQIHETINDWLDSDKEGSLGDMISDIVGGDDNSEEDSSDAGNATATPTATPDGNTTATSTADGA
jgi:hypothetical protein